METETCVSWRYTVKNEEHRAKDSRGVNFSLIFVRKHSE